MLEQEINDNILDINHDKLQLLEQKKTNLVNIRRQKIEGVILRSKCRYLDLGEKPTEYFLNLESSTILVKLLANWLMKMEMNILKLMIFWNFKKNFIRNYIQKMKKQMQMI